MTEHKFTEADYIEQRDFYAFNGVGGSSLYDMLTQAARAVAEVGALKRVTQNLIDALPDTRKLLLAREDAAAILREKKEKQGGN